nr:response regulator [Desulfobulbaceae bacterium]
MLERNSFSVVITDMMMPKMDGMQLLAHIKRHHPGTDVVVITGHSDNYIYSNIIDAGGTDFIIKPFEGDELEAKLNRVFRERRLIQGLETEIVDRKEAEMNLLAAKINVENANLLKDSLIDDLCGTMDEMLANRDHYTFEHALRVAEISKRIGKVMGGTEEEIGVMLRAGLVHDIGKIAIDVGQKFYDSVEKYNSCTGDGSPSRMFRRGADYLFYIVGTTNENQKLIGEIYDHLRLAEEEWGVSAKPDSQEFAMGYPIDQALGELFRSSV